VTSRRRVRIALGVLWILDGALQLQPFMFGRGFAREVIAPAGDGQPAFVESAVNWAADLVSANPVPWDVVFAGVQILIGVGILLPRTVKVALLASLVWSGGVWLFGEGLGGLASGHADLLTGAPGAVLLYAVLAAGIWPPVRESGDTRPAWWLPVAWGVLWVGGAALQLLPGQNKIGDVSGTLRDNAVDAPSWLAHLDHSAASGLTSVGTPVVVALVAVQAAVGLAALPRGALRDVAGWAGIVVSVLFWVYGQSVGELWTGQSTDPNTAPLVILLGLAMMASPAAATRASREPSQSPQPTAA
jgi:hypothetical protein